MNFNTGLLQNDNFSFLLRLQVHSLEVMTFADELVICLEKLQKITRPSLYNTRVCARVHRLVCVFARPTDGPC